MQWLARRLGLAVLVTLIVAGGRPAHAQEAGETIVEGTGGRIAGRVVDRKTSAPVAGATVQVVGRKTVVQTSKDGAYEVIVPAGTHQLRVSAPSYEAATVSKVRVVAGETVKADATLSAVSTASGGIIVNVLGRIRRAAESVQLARRKAAAAVTETISAETMKKSVGSDATAAVQRATAVTVRETGGSKTVFVRGLGDRYTTALLNGSRLPSPDALRRAVPLDLFPSDFLEGIDVIKGYTPDLPGDFSGGLIDMRLRDFPDKLTYSYGVSSGANASTAGQEFLTYQGSGYKDYFGYGQGFRNWPTSMPSFDLDELPDKRQYQIGREFKDIWQYGTKTGLPDWGTNFSLGNRYGNLGFQLGGLYNVRSRTVRDFIQRQFTNAGTTDDPEIALRDNFKGTRSTLATRLGGILTTAWQPAENHTIALRGFVNRTSTDETRAETGVDFQQNFVDQWRLKYYDDQLLFGQLGGEHGFDLVKVDWRTVLGQTLRTEPDTRNIAYTRSVDEPDAPLSFSDQALGGTRIFNSTTEGITDSNVDFTVPFLTPGIGMGNVWKGLNAKFKFGPAYSFRRRYFRQRRVEFSPDTGGLNVTLPPDELLDPGNIGPGGVDVTETSLPTDQFTGTHEVAGGYGMFELPILPSTLRAVFGTRVEYSLINLDTFVISSSICGEDASSCPASFHKKNIDPLPSAALIYNPHPDVTVRLSWSQTVSRPELRELAPVDFPAQRGDRAVVGNPDLQEFKISNWDARMDFFPSPLELVSFSFFLKEMDGPIEPITLLRSSELVDSFVNTQSGELFGIEGEVRKNLGFLNSVLRDVSLTVNGTWLHSRVVVGTPSLFAQQVFPTTPIREAVGAPPFTAGGALEYSNPELLTARLDYATAGRTLDRPGAVGLPNLFEERRDRLNVVMLVPLKRFFRGTPLSMKLSVENILNDTVDFVRDDGRATPGTPIIQRRWTDGVTFGLGFSVSY